MIQVFDLMRKQEKTRLAESAADKSRNDAIQAHSDIVSVTNNHKPLDI